MKKHIIIATLLSVALLAGCKSAPAEMSEVTIDGPVRPIPAWIQKPELCPGERAPFVIICHGLTGFAQESHLTTIADSLQARGIGSIRFNFNGHGGDYKDFEKHTISKEIEEVKAVYDYVASLPWVDASRIGLTGHSQGGFVSGAVAGELGADKIACLCLLAPAACIYTMAQSRQIWGNDFSDADFDALAAAADADSTACQGIPFWKGLTLGWGYLADSGRLNPWTLAARYTGPAMIIQGGADGEDLIKDSRAYCDYMPEIEYVELEGLSHCYPENLPLVGSKAAEFFAGHLLNIPF